MAGRTVGVKSVRRQESCADTQELSRELPPLQYLEYPWQALMLPALFWPPLVGLELTPLRRAALWVSLGVAALLACGIVAVSRVRARRQAGGWRNANSTSSC